MADPYQDHPNVAPASGGDSIWSSQGGSQLWLPMLILSAKSFGVVGDGITDDTAAIDRAIAACANKELYFPGSTYKTAGGHVISSPMRITGAGRGTIGAANGITTFSLANGANSDMFTVKAKNVVLSNFGAYGNKSNQSSTSRGIVFDAASAIAFFTLEDLWIDSFRDSNILVQTSGTSVSESVIDHVESRNAGGRGIDVAVGANDLTISNCQVALCGLSGIYQNASGKQMGNHCWGNGTLNTNNDFAGTSIFGSVQINGGQYESNGSVGGAGRGIDIRGIGNSVSDADVYLNKGNGIYAFRNSAFTMGLTLQGNRCYSNGQTSGAGIALDTLTGAVVMGNHCYDPQGTKTQVNGIAELNNPNYVTYFGNVSRTVDNKTAGWSLGTGANNVPLAANIATTNIT